MDPAALSTTELLARAAASALAADRDDAALWRLIGQLQERATPEVFDAAAAWCRAPERDLRLLGAYVLGDLGIEEMWPFAAECDPVLMPLLADVDPDVAAAAIVSIEKLNIGDNLEIARRADHPARQVRLAVAGCLSAFGDPDTSDALIALSRDPDVEVRRAAVNGLASQPQPDSEAIRLALVERLCDADRAVVEEALWGLAVRGDARGDAVLRAALEAPDVPEIVHMAAFTREMKAPAAGPSKWPPRQ
jgi:HEAT repeat protein